MIILCDEVVKYYLLPLYSNVELLFIVHIIFLFLSQLQLDPGFKPLCQSHTYYIFRRTKMISK